MEDGQASEAKAAIKAAGWKRALAFGAGFGVASALTLAVIGGCVYWYISRPKGWDSGRIKCVSATAGQTFEFDDAKKTMTANGFQILFVLENTRNADYTLPQTITILARDKKTSALDDFFGAKIDHGYTIPARERAVVRVDKEYSCGITELETGKVTERDPQACFDDAFGAYNGFVGLDYDTRTRLNLMQPTLPPASSQKAQEPSEKPKDDPYAAIAKPDPCEPAKRLASACRTKGFRPTPSSGNGWQPMPDFPSVPRGAELVPDQNVCNIAFQWQDFCTWKKKD